MRRACRIAYSLVLAVMATACGKPTEDVKAPQRVLEAASFNDLVGWREDDPGPALHAFRRSCARIGRDPTAPLGDHAFAGPNAMWREICSAAALVDAADDADVRLFFENNFVVYAVLDGDEPEGLFTGYFEPELDGAVYPDERFNVPIHRLPQDLITLQLGDFGDQWAGEKLTGRIHQARFVPYFSRAEIDDGALSDRELEILYVDDAIEKFFLQIQGSGRIRLEDGRVFRIGYAGQNGHPYRAIGRDLIEQGEIAAEDMSLQAIDTWLRANPTQAARMMHNNPSYIFFELHDSIDPEEGPYGAQSVPLTPGRSLAIDRRFLPLGVPVWLETTVIRENGDDVPWRHLMITQDTGGAIRGVVRGDVFFGWGEQARADAGHMKSRGRYYILLPRAMRASS